MPIGILSKSTMGMTDALEIGEVAEQYLAEGNYALALEKFQSCLSVLVPQLGKEPLGRRRDLLHKQVIDITIDRNTRFIGKRCTLRAISAQSFSKHCDYIGSVPSIERKKLQHLIRF